MMTSMFMFTPSDDSRRISNIVLSPPTGTFEIRCSTHSKKARVEGSRDTLQSGPVVQYVELLSKYSCSPVVEDSVEDTSKLNR